MEAGKQGLLTFLGQNQQSSIPIFQRKYSWTNKECKQLWEDILRVGNSNEDNHFIGSVVYMKENPVVMDPISNIMIIDGQQRITTITLLISAIVEFLSENPNEQIIRSNGTVFPADNLISYYLIHERELGENRYRLLLTQDDKNTLIKIIDNLSATEKIPFNDNDSKRLKENFDYFKKKINKNNFQNVYDGLSKLLIIYVALEQGKDNPQLIFESLNSTGLELTKSDLIRNYILMDLLPEEQEKLYNTYWHDIEVLFEKNDGDFDKFIRDYLIVKTNKKIKFENIYTEFKIYASQTDLNDLVIDIHKYALYFESIAFGGEENPKLQASFESLRSMDYDVTDSFMLHLYRDYDEHNLSTDDFCSIIKYTESYLLRRLICSIPTNSLKNTYENMYGEIDNTNHFNSYKNVLLSKENNYRMPNDVEFSSNFLFKDIFHLNPKNKRYIWDKFENWERKERKDIKSDTHGEWITVEHVMPQNSDLSVEWQIALGERWEEIQDTYLHTLGNLTLTGCNSEMGDKPFEFKQKILKKSSISLNRYFDDVEDWNGSEIKIRADLLINKAKKIWPYP